MTTLVNIPQNSGQKETLINRNTKAVAPAGFFAERTSAVSGLNWAYYGGVYNSNAGVETNIADGTILMNASSINYVEYNTTTNAVVKNTLSFTSGYLPIAQVVTGTTSVTTYTDKRRFPLLPTGVLPTLGAGSGSALTTAAADYDLVTVVGLVVTLKGPQANIGNAHEYTGNLIQQISNITVTLPNNTNGYIVMVSGSPWATSITTAASNANNIQGLLYRFVTSAGVVTTLIDVSRSNFTRLVGGGYETSLGVSGNLSKANTITAPWNTQNPVGNYSTGFRYELYLKCLTAQFGYAIGDIVLNPLTGPVGAATTAAYPVTAAINGTNGATVNFLVDAAVKVQQVTGTPGALADVTPANWQWRIRVLPIR